MKRLGENVFQFRYTMLENAFYDWSFAYIPIFVGFLIIIGQYSEGQVGMAFLFLVITIAAFSLCISERRYVKDGVIIDNDRAVVVLHKWTWNPMGKSNFEEIPISEIMGTQRDVDVTTTTKYTSGKWNTTESRSYNVVLQGKFGSKRFKLAYLDDWNLFMTLLYGEG